MHTTKNATWINAAGDAVPLKFVPKSDRRKEELAAKLHALAIKQEQALNSLHDLMKNAFKEIEQLVRTEYELKNGKKKQVGEKGNITWFSFDRSVKIEANVNDIVKWDSALMTESLTLLNAYISSNMTEANILIAGLVKSAFSNTKGMIDTAKVYQILRHEDQIKDKRFQKACELIKQASSIDRTKLYMRIWEKADDGQYRNINLNFSGI